MIVARRQLALPKTAGWGGARKGAGRPPRAKQAGVSHLMRPVLKARFPLHVTMRLREDVAHLRNGRCFKALKLAFKAGCDKFGFRLNHFSVQDNHLHFVVEANDRRALSRGMQGLNIRMARAINRVIGRKGKVFSDRYHARPMKTPTDVRNVLIYQLGNRTMHFGEYFHRLDPFTSWALKEPPTITPRTWLLRTGWRRARGRPDRTQAVAAATAGKPIRIQ